MNDDAAMAGLLADVRRVVAAYEDEGWFIDEDALTEIEKILLESACRAPIPARQRALELLATEAQGDPERAFYEAQGRLTFEVKEALSSQRRWIALRRTLERSDECPFWLTPDPEFTGRQTARDKWLVHLESGGLLDLRHRNSELGLGAGGNGRLLLGKGFGEQFHLLLGGEVGGGAELGKPNTGQPLSIRYVSAVPLVVRWHWVAWFYDVEVAPVALFENDDTRLSWGGRVGTTVGLTALRLRDFLPWFGLTFGVEHYLPSGGRESTQLLRGGVRVGIRWDP